MKRRRSRVWLGLTLSLLVLALPVYADTASHVRALFFQAADWGAWGWAIWSRMTSP